MNSRENSSILWTSRVKHAAFLFFKRRKFIVNQRLQYRLLVLALCYTLFFIISVAAMLFVPLILKLNTIDLMSPEASQVASGLLYLHNNYWLTVLLPLVIIALHSILTSHRIAGPLYRFNRVFNDIERGWLPKRIQLRKGDYLTEEMDHINRMIHSLRDRIEYIQNIQGELRDALLRCSESFDEALPGKQRQALKELEHKSTELEKKLSEFRIEA